MINPKCGDTVIYTNSNGYDNEREALNKHINKGHELTIKSIDTGGFRTTYEFYEINGKHNSVMFEPKIDINQLNIHIEDYKISQYQLNTVINEINRLESHKKYLMDCINTNKQMIYKLGYKENF